MKRPYQIVFIGIFLLIIYTVPAVQTVREIAINEGHRIQMLDLFSDIFITPAKKAAIDRAAIGLLGRTIDTLRIEAGAGQDTSKPWDPQQAIRLCDESLTTADMLGRSVVDYNRHLQGKANKFAARDTLRPYYQAIVKAHSDLTALLALLQNGAWSPDIAAGAAALQSDVSGMQRLFGAKKGLAAYPGLVLNALRRIMVGADYLRPYEKEMEKNSVFANTIRPWLSTAYYAAFGDLGSKGVRGKGGWIFYCQDVDYLVKPFVLDERSRIVDPNDAPITENIVDSVVAFKNQLAKIGVDLLFVIMPTKPSIYPDMLNPAMKAESAGKITHSLRMMAALEKAGVKTVDLFTVFARERKNDGAQGDSLYLHRDTHFKRRGVRASATTIADAVKAYPWFKSGTVEYVIDSIVVPREGDIAEMAALPDMNKRLGRRPFPAEPTKCYQVYRLTRDASGAVIDRTLYKDDFKHSAILVLGDSFSRIYQTDEPRSAGWISHLALELAQPVASVVNDGGSSTLVRQSLARRPNLLKGKKLVVWEVVERDFRFGDEGWKDVPITANQENRGITNE